MGKRNVKIFMTLLLVFVLATVIVGCAGNDKGKGSDSDAQLSSRSEEISKTDTATPDSNEKSENKDSVENGKTLVVYFSHSGNTKKIAEEIQSKMDADIFEIKTVNTYSDDYDTVLDEAQEELNDKARPKLSESVEDMAQYQTVIIGYPIWWGDMPMAVYSFLDEYDLSGKTILPFCTHGGSGISGTDKNIQDEEKEANITEGLAISDSSLDDANGNIDNWLKDNGVID